ncbi:hypothetical protein OPIT5_27220 [Opitutaceae bacterium TAV5]|nr:hypothetical protein OPIT5_27220 [Opitutaceae bacterium TAV5]
MSRVPAIPAVAATGSAPAERILPCSRRRQVFVALAGGNRQRDV